MNGVWLERKLEEGVKSMEVRSPSWRCLVRKTVNTAPGGKDNEVVARRCDSRAAEALFAAEGKFRTVIVKWRSRTEREKLG